MALALLIAASVVVLSGLVFKYVLVRFFDVPDWHISWCEFVAGVVIALAVVLPSVFGIGKLMVSQDALRYEEFYNGVETSATVSFEECYPGSSGGSESSGRSNCYHEYRTGETYTYTVQVPQSDTKCDDKGNCTTTTTYRTEFHTGYIYAPYAHKEYHYTITDSLGGSYRFPSVYVKDGEGYLGQGIAN